jgi:hypothetical protein
MVRLRGDLVPKWAQPRPSVEDQVAILEPEDASSFAAFEGFSYRPGVGSAAPPGASGRLGVTSDQFGSQRGSQCVLSG